MIQLVHAASNRARLVAARDFVRSFPPGTEILLVGPSRDPVDDFVRRELAASHPTFGLHRYGLVQLASHLAATELAATGLAPATSLGLEAVAARATFAARQSQEIPRFAAVDTLPGFPRAAAATLQELRLAGIDAVGDPDLDALLRHTESALDRAGSADLARLLRAAIAGLQAPPQARLRALPLVLLDVPVASPLEAELVRALCRSAPSVLATVPPGDESAIQLFESLEGVPLPGADAAPASSLDHLREHLFATSVPPAAPADAGVTFFSAPGEGRECVEIAREILRAAERGVPFEAMAVFLRVPETYSTFADIAFRRAGIPTYFARGTLRPDPAGRAFLALLACAGEGLSARRFAEYLAFAQVPALDADGGPPAARAVWPAPQADEFDAVAAAMAVLAAPRAAAGEQLLFWDLDAFTTVPEVHAHARRRAPRRSRPARPTTPEADPGEPDGDEPTPAGTLPAPRKWEELLVEAAVIGGLSRWQRRLAGLARELALQLDAIAAVEPESPRTAGLQRDLQHLGHLERFALPLIETLAAFPARATWGTWVDVLATLAPRVLRRPERTLAVLGEMLPMADVGPVDLDEVRQVLTERLSTLEVEPPAQRDGRVFIGRPEQARGRTFAVVFVPGLSERVFPQRPREDPLLLDAARARLAPTLRTQEQRSRDERLLLALALGAAEERVVLSYSRLDAAAARPRVPSFYALDTARALHGVIPDFHRLERDAAAQSQARLGWPAPLAPADSIDAVEHDLAVLGSFMHATPPHAAKGRARYLLELNPHLARALRARYLRWQQPWRPEDGLVHVTPATQEFLATQRPSARAYSVTALQRFAACPYQFFLAAIHRLEPRPRAVALVQLDPLTRGRMIHHVQAETLRALRAADALPVGDVGLDAAEAVLDRTLAQIAATYHDDLAPAIERIWEDEIAAMRADLRLWLRALAVHSHTWRPLQFEFAFGLGGGTAATAAPSASPGGGSVDAGRHDGPARDAASVPQPATLPDGWLLRGAVDLVEERRADGALRVTDHKTGADHTYDGLLVGGGEVLQPVFYALAVQALQQRQVVEGRLFFCTSRGRFRERIVPIGPFALEYAGQILRTVDESVAQGMLPPLPRDGACQMCDFRVVCGPHEEIRSRRKQPVPALTNLREFP